MKNTTLTITFNTEKLDALFFHMGKKDANLQEELNDIIQKLYEKYVPLAGIHRRQGKPGGRGKKYWKKAEQGGSQRGRGIAL
mgnify:CR=1 FL=1